jgi:CRP/FNR family transcriptional regulator, cyclic AMP receptor protein
MGAVSSPPALPMSSLLDLCKGLPTLDLATGELLLEEGGQTGKLYVLVEGSTLVSKGAAEITRVGEPGAFFGEMSILLGTPHTATVRALSPSRFYVVEDFTTFLSSPDVTLALSRLLAKRLQMVTTYLADVKQQFAEHADHLGIVDEVLDSLLHHQHEEH